MAKIQHAASAPTPAPGAARLDSSAPTGFRAADGHRRRPGLAGLAGWGIAAALSVLAGCAALGEPVNQELALRTLVGDERVEALCEVSNDKGRWSLAAPANFAVTRSSAPLTVECHSSDGLVASETFEASGEGESIAGSNVSSGYPYRLEVRMAHPDPSRQSHDAPVATAVDPGQLPHLDAEGKAAWSRFLAGELPRAFAISDSGQWIRVNGARSAGRLAMDRCVTLGGSCALYAVDNAVVWEDRDAARFAISR